MCDFFLFFIFLQCQYIQFFYFFLISLNLSFLMTTLKEIPRAVTGSRLATHRRLTPPVYVA